MRRRERKKGGGERREEEAKKGCDLMGGIGTDGVFKRDFSFVFGDLEGRRERGGGEG